MILLAALLLQTEPAGQKNPAPDIVVTAPTVPTVRAIEKLTQTITPPAEEGYARLNEPLCIQVAGLSPATGAAIADRVLADAALAGVAGAGEHCTPNLAIEIVADSRAATRAAMHDKPWLFAGINPIVRARLEADTGPVHAWSTLEVRGADGEREGTGFAGTSPGPSGPPVLAVHLLSRIKLTTRYDIMGTVILIDKAAVHGKTVAQIADYCAMRALADAQPPTAGKGGDTILALFSGSEAIPELTRFDQAYLRAIYEGPANTLYISKVSDVATSVHQALAQGKSAR